LTAFAYHAIMIHLTISCYLCAFVSLAFCIHEFGRLRSRK